MKINHSKTKDVICPWCGDEQSRYLEDVLNGWEYFCGKCNKEFSLEFNDDDLFTTEKVED